MQNSIGKRIKELRESRGIKATFVAQKIGISQPLLSMIEREKCNPPFNSLIPMSDFFGVSIDYLVKGESNETNNANFA
jgi:transcriptional regulator with XRE-family HTH domain